MARTLSSRALQALFAQETDEVFILLLTINHINLLEPIRVCSDAKDVVSRGNTYLAFPFELSLPTDLAEQMPQAELQIDNIDRRIVQAVRLINSPATVQIEGVLLSTPDVVELAWTMTMREVTYDVLTVTGSLRFEEIFVEAFPKDRVTPATIPAVFANF